MNGGFESGLDGWMWEQWLGKPLPGILDRSDRADGAAAFRMGISGADGPRWLATEIPIKEPGRDHIFAFALKLKNVPQDAARVRLAIPDRGFIQGGDLVRLGGTQGWKTYRFAVPGTDLSNASKVTVFFYHDQIGNGTIGIDAVSLVSGTLPAGEAAQSGPSVTLTGDTNRPDLSLFPLGEEVRLSFAATGLQPRHPGLSLELTIKDEHGTRIQAISVPVAPDASGNWHTVVAAPHRRLGFYRVYVRLSSGVPLQPLGSRPAGFLTYAVVPDPQRRIGYPEDQTRFGMQGAPWEGDACRLMGIRWVLEGALYWNRAEPDHAGQFGPEQIRQYEQGRNPGSADFHVYTLPPLFMAPSWAVVPSTHIYETGTLTPEGEKAWASYCAVAARAYMARNPDRKSRFYQITWEPIPPWGFKGNDQDLIRIYQIAYRVLHQTDPRAVVAGPCRGIWNNGDPQDTERLFRLGLGKYLDAYLSHPYHTITPEKDGMPQAVRTVRSMLRVATGRDLPMYGAEQGWPTDEDVSKEALQAQGLLRQNLITLGEGYKINMAFTFYDYRMEGSRTGYGYFYNLTKGVPFGPDKMSPKPIAPAWAAQSMLLEGHDTAGAIEWLGDKVWGYAFERPGSRVLALWCYGNSPQRVTVPTGTSRVDVYDWMGRGRVMRTKAGDLSLLLGSEPTYVAGVSPRMWGSSASRTLSISERPIAAFPGGRATVTGSLLAPGTRPFRGTLAIEAGVRLRGRSVSCRVQVRPGSRVTWRLEVPVPANLSAGSYAKRLVLRDPAGDIAAVRSVTLHVRAPVSVRVAPVFEAGAVPGLAVSFINHMPSAMSGVATLSLRELRSGAARSDAPMIDLVRDPGKSVEVAGTKRRMPFVLAPRSTRQFIVSLHGASLSPSRMYQAVAELVTARGWNTLQTVPVTFVPAYRLSRPPVIDGDLSEWAAIPAISLSAPSDVIRSEQLCPKSFSARLRITWDNRALYVAAEVSDDIFCQPYTGDGIWRGDCIQLAFNLDSPRPEGSGGASKPRTSEITVALTPEGAQAYRHLSSAPDRLALGPLTRDQLPLSVRHLGTARLIYEMTVPWATLGVVQGQSVRAGDAIGIGATVNEVRMPDQRDPCALGLFGGIYPDKDPNHLGTMILAGPTGPVRGKP